MNRERKKYPSRKRRPTLRWHLSIAALKALGSPVIAAPTALERGEHGQWWGIRQRVIELLYFEAEHHRGRGVTWDWWTVYPSPPHLQEAVDDSLAGSRLHTASVQPKGRPGAFFKIVGY